MTEQLKTLKDINKANFDECPQCGLPIAPSTTFIPESELKEQAIKWIKELQTKSYQDYANETDCVVTWIKHFFNISDGEIKNIGVDFGKGKDRTFINGNEELK